jgi:hypothetical protein
MVAAARGGEEIYLYTRVWTCLTARYVRVKVVNGNSTHESKLARSTRITHAIRGSVETNLLRVYARSV